MKSFITLSETAAPLPAYRSPVWLPGGQLQTIYAYYLKPKPHFGYRRERWETPDGDFIDLDWLDGPSPSLNVVVLFHGLEGSAHSHYAVCLMRELQRERWAAVVPHFRGCSGEANRLGRSYHAGDSTELNWILRRIKERHGDHRIYAVGVSLGGNDLLKWLGEQGEAAVGLIDKAVAVSAPVDLERAAHQLDYGLNKIIYTRQFLRTMKPKALAKIARNGISLDSAALRVASTFREIDNLFTAPVHGFKDAEDYWKRSSSKPWLKHIKVPTLLISARNDPFYPGALLPTAAEVSPSVVLDYPATGGHVGFVSGTFPGSLDWLPKRIVNFYRAGI